MAATRKYIAFSEYDAVGFDVDHTLAKYNLPNLFDLAYGCLAKFMVENKGYDKKLLEPFKEHKDFNTRGIVLDIQKGNFLKLSEKGTIVRASHGTKFMKKDDIEKHYGTNCHLPAFEQLVKKVTNIDGYRIFENFFDMPGSLLCGRVIDIVDEQESEHPKDYGVYLKDIMEAYEFVYRPQGYEEDTGGFFPEYKRNVEKYINPCTDEVKKWLLKLRKEKKLFIITSSYPDFATQTIEAALGSKWDEYFDICVFWARKPGFFSTDRPFNRVENFKEKGPVADLKVGQTYSQGNYGTFMEFLQKETCKQKPKVLYFGDSLRSDVFPAKEMGRWDTVMVLEEMVAESHNSKTEEPSEPNNKKIKYVGPSDEEKDYLTSEQWGSLFCDTLRSPAAEQDTEGFVEMNTLWGYIIRKYADIAIPQLEYLTDFPLDHKYDVFDHEDPRKWGFYPVVPEALMLQMLKQ